MSGPRSSRSVQPVLFQPAEESPAAPGIPGLQYLPDFVTPAEEERLVVAIDSEPWDTTWERRRQPYGAGYGSSAESPRPIPAWTAELLGRIHSLRLMDRPFDQMLVNEYEPGQGISLHRDYDPFDRVVVSLSLLSACVMDFRRLADGHRESLLLAPRSLLILADEARYEWEHGIARRKNDRWMGRPIPRARRLSVTFRVLKK